MLIRYPGGKQKLAHEIVYWLKTKCENDGITQYREPFFGAGGIGFELLESFDQIESARINDKDHAIACLWYTVYYNLEELLDRIDELNSDLDEFVTEPEGDKKGNGTSFHRCSLEVVEWFYGWQDDLRKLKESNLMPPKHRRSEYAWKKLACHQMSYSGLATEGGPIGGKKQDSPWGVGCRFFRDSLRKNAQDAHNILHNVKDWGSKDICTAKDFLDILDEPGKAIIYLDPPYYKQGSKLYLHSFDDKDHKRLADRLKEEKENPWILSYDVCDDIKKLYKGKGIYVQELPLTYSIVWHDVPEGEQLKAKGRTELVISNFNLKELGNLPEKPKKKKALKEAVGQLPLPWAG